MRVLRLDLPCKKLFSQLLGIVFQRVDVIIRL